MWSRSYLSFIFDPYLTYDMWSRSYLPFYLWAYLETRNEAVIQSLCQQKQYSLVHDPYLTYDMWSRSYLPFYIFIVLYLVVQHLSNGFNTLICLYQIPRCFWDTQGLSTDVRYTTSLCLTFFWHANTRGESKPGRM